MTNYTCPAGNCGTTWESKEAVKGHWGGMQDESHTGAFHKAWEAFQKERNGDKPDTNELDGEDEEPDEDPSENEPDASVGKDPVKGSGNTNDVESQSDVSLPCGHETFDPDEAPEPPYQVGCETCGETWTVRE